MGDECSMSLLFYINNCYANMAAKHGNFHIQSLDGLTTQQSAESAQFLIESCNMKDKTMNLLFKIHRDFWIPGVSRAKF